MAKSKTSSSNNKISFGKRKGGKAQKSKRKKDKPVSEYRGQGR